MPTLNVNVSQETLDKLESLKQFGKGRVVSIAVEIMTIDQLLEVLKQAATSKSKKDSEK